MRLEFAGCARLVGVSAEVQLVRKAVDEQGGVHLRPDNKAQNEGGETKAGTWDETGRKRGI